MNRDKTITVRVSSDELNIIKAKAAGRGVSISKFMSECALAEQGFTDSLKREFDRHLINIKDLTINSRADFETKNKIITECDALWQF